MPLCRKDTEVIMCFRLNFLRRVFSLSPSLHIQHYIQHYPIGCWTSYGIVLVFSFVSTRAIIDTMMREEWEELLHREGDDFGDLRVVVSDNIVPCEHGAFAVEAALSIVDDDVDDEDDEGRLVFLGHMLIVFSYFREDVSWMGPLQSYDAIPNDCKVTLTRISNSPWPNDELPHHCWDTLEFMPL